MNFWHWRDLATGVVLFAALVLSGFIAARERIGIVLLVLLSLVWLTVDRWFEGGTLIAFDHAHGLVTSDLVGLAGLATAAWLAVRDVRRRSRPGGTRHPRRSRSQ